MFSRNLESLAKYVIHTGKEIFCQYLDTESVLQINIELKRIKCEFQMKSNSLWKIPLTISSSCYLITLSYSGKTQISVCLTIAKCAKSFFFSSFLFLLLLIFIFFFSPLPPIVKFYKCQTRFYRHPYDATLSLD